MSAATAAWTAAAQLSQKNMQLSISKIYRDNKHFRPKNSLLNKEKTPYMMFKKQTDFMGDLFAQENAKDLSWLDEPSQPLKPRAPEPDLFGVAKKEVKPQTYLSKRIMKEYWPRISTFPLEEQQGLIQALDEAVARKKAGGYQQALAFLEKKAAQSSRTSLYFVVAKRMLIVSTFFLATDAYLQSLRSEQKILNRLTQNPSLFLDASQADLEMLSHSAQAVAVCRSITHALNMLAKASLTQEELQLLPARAPLSPFIAIPAR